MIHRHYSTISDLRDEMHRCPDCGAKQLDPCTGPLATCWGRTELRIKTEERVHSLRGASARWFSTPEVTP